MDYVCRQINFAGSSERKRDNSRSYGQEVSWGAERRSQMGIGEKLGERLWKSLGAVGEKRYFAAECGKNSGNVGKSGRFK